MVPNIVGVQLSRCRGGDSHLHIELLLTDDFDHPSPTGSYALVGVQPFDTEVIEVDEEASGLATDTLRFQLLAADVSQVMEAMTPASREAFEKVADTAGVKLGGSLAGAELKSSDDDDEEAPGQYL